MTKIDLIARGIIVHDGKILLCKNLEQGHYFLPGGHVEEGESQEETFAREMQEEMGKDVSKVQKIIDVNNSHVYKEQEFNEIISVYIVALKDYSNIKSLEDHIDFAWVPLSGLATSAFKPIEMVPEILKCVEDNRGFWLEGNI
jgi:ADP-ribose pyrophosphatase YjhB (NUDIX family)